MFTHIYGEGGNPRLASAHQPGLSKLRTVGYFFFFNSSDSFDINFNVISL